MTLTWPVLAAVLLGGLLHATWNALVKASTDKALDNALIHATASLVGLPLLLVTGLPAPAAWPYIGASIAIHVGYFFTLSQAYRHGDLGLTYPLMRGSAPLVVALCSATWIGESLSPVAWAGMLAVSAGVLTLGLSRQALESPRAVAFALTNAVLIACYTLVDGLGVRAGGDVAAYVVTLFALNGWLFGGLVLARRGLRTSWAYARQRAPVALLGAVASVLSYGIALWAMTRAPVATIAALRETSVLFAALIGTWLLKESFSPRRAAGTVVIVAGVVALRLG